MNLRRISILLPLAGVALVLVSANCTNSASNDSGSPCGTIASSETAHIMQGLEPSCGGCHASGTRGYFGSLATFQNLFVADPLIVAPGKPDESTLIKLLEGNASGAFSQMPPAGDSYAKMVDAKKSDLTIADIRSWISHLPAQVRDPSPNVNAALLARISAPQLQRALYQQLGLTHDDFYSSATEYGIVMAESRNDDMYPVQGPDALPAPREAAPAERFFGFGGAAATVQVRADLTPGPNFGNTLVQVSQAWCRIALKKPTNSALFPSGAQSAVPADVKATIARWWLHFLAETPKPTDIDALYTNVFVPLQTTGDTEAAHVGVCSYFIRHPHWVFY